VDRAEQRGGALPHRHGLAHDRRLHRDGDQRPHPHRDLQRQSERGELDSGRGDNLPDTTHQKHADVGLHVGLVALDRDTTADNLSKAGWSLGWFLALDLEARTIWIVDAHDYGKRFIVRADEKLTAFPELESAIRKNCLDTVGRRLTQPKKTTPASARA
jgi:hypothetical protein